MKNKNYFNIKSENIFYCLLILGILFLAGCSSQKMISQHITKENDNVNAELSFDSTPESGKETSFQIKIQDKNRKPINNLHVKHDRLVHAIIVSEDLESMAHIHPEDFAGEGISKIIKDSGVYSFKFTFPKAGMYVLAMNILTKEGEYAKRFIIDVKGIPKMNKIIFDARTKKIFQGISEEGGKDRYVKFVDSQKIETISQEGYFVTLSTPSIIKPDQSVVLTEHFEKNGKPFTELSIFLGAPMHFVIVKEGLDIALHTHGTLPNSVGSHMGNIEEQIIGPDINLETTFPEPGIYRIFGQAKHKNKIIFTSFMVEVKS